MDGIRTRTEENTSVDGPCPILLLDRYRNDGCHPRERRNTTPSRLVELYDAMCIIHVMRLIHVISCSPTLHSLGSTFERKEKNASRANSVWYRARKLKRQPASVFFSMAYSPSSCQCGRIWVSHASEHYAGGGGVRMTLARSTSFLPCALCSICKTYIEASKGQTSESTRHTVLPPK